MISPARRAPAAAASFIYAGQQQEPLSAAPRAHRERRSSGCLFERQGDRRSVHRPLPEGDRPGGQDADLFDTPAGRGDAGVSISAKRHPAVAGAGGRCGTILRLPGRRGPGGRDGWVEVDGATLQQCATPRSGRRGDIAGGAEGQGPPPPRSKWQVAGGGGRDRSRPSRGAEATKTYDGYTSCPAGSTRVRRAMLIEFGLPRQPRAELSPGVIPPLEGACGSAG